MVLKFVIALVVLLSFSIPMSARADTPVMSGVTFYPDFSGPYPREGLIFRKLGANWTQTKTLLEPVYYIGQCTQSIEGARYKIVSETTVSGQPALVIRKGC